jgi:hypothetical protein
MAQKPKQPKQQSDDRETVPFDEALRRMVNTPPKHKAGGKSGGAAPGQARHGKARQKKSR